MRFTIYDLQQKGTGTIKCQLYTSTFAKSERERESEGQTFPMLKISKQSHADSGRQQGCGIARKEKVLKPLPSLVPKKPLRIPRKC